MSEAGNRAIVRRVYEEIFNWGNLTLVDELYAKYFVGHHPDREFRGWRGVKDVVSMYRTAFPDMCITMEDLFATGDEVVTRTTVTGTHHGALGDLPPTGRAVTVTGLGITRLRDGKIVEQWDQFDQLGMMEQLRPSQIRLSRK